MSTMNMPGFTADASLYKASEHYQQQFVSATVAFGIQPALRRGGLASKCGDCACDEGQCCRAHYRSIGALVRSSGVVPQQSDCEIACGVADAACLIGCIASGPWYPLCA